MQAKRNDGGDRLASMLAKYMKGGMMYGNGGPLTEGEDSEEVDPNSPEFQEYLEYRTRGNGNPLYHEEYKGEPLNPDNLRELIREQGSSMAIPKSLMPDVADRYMNEPMPGSFTSPGAKRTTMSDAMAEAQTRYEQNRALEQEYLEYMKGKKGEAAPRREPGMRLENTPQGELTQAEIALRRSLGL